MGKASRLKKDREAPVASDRRPPPLPQVRIRLGGGAAPAWRHALALITIAVAAIAIYQPSLSGEFVFDDHNAIVQSLLVRDIWPLERFLTHSNRPLMDFSFAVNYAQGGYDTWWFHATNVGLHALTAMVLYLLALRTLRLPGTAERYGALSQPIAWAAAALFVCHPLASDTVGYIASRSEGLTGLFYLLTMLAYSLTITAETDWIRTATRWAIPFTTVLALASKEIAVTIPLAILLYDFVFVAGGDLRHTRARAGLIALSLVPLMLGGAYYVFRALVSGNITTPFQQSAGFGFDRYTPLEYLYTQFGVIAHYLRLLIVPTGLNFDYDWPLATSLFAPGVLLPLVILLGLTALAVRCLKSHPFFTFAFLFMLVVLAPTSSFMPLADLIVERRMYIPLAGFALCAAAAGADLARRLAADRALIALAAAAIVAVVPLAAVTRARAAQWGDQLLLFEDAVRKSPGSPRVRLNLGVVHLNAGRRDQAYEVLTEAKRLFDEGRSIHAFPRIGAFIHYNLGAIQFIREDYEASMQEMQRAIEVGGHYVALRPRSYAVIGYIHMIYEEFAAAEVAFTEALKYSRDHPEWMHGLTDAQIQQGKFEDARATLFRLHHTHPELIDSEESARLRKLIYEHQREQRKRARQKAADVTD